MNSLNNTGTAIFGSLWETYRTNTCLSANPKHFSFDEARLKSEQSRHLSDAFVIFITLAGNAVLFVSCRTWRFRNLHSFSFRSAFRPRTAAVVPSSCPTKITLKLQKSALGIFKKEEGFGLHQGHIPDIYWKSDDNEIVKPFNIFFDQLQRR